MFEPPRAGARRVDAPPDGFRYEPGFLVPEEERELLARFDELDFREIVMKGVVAAADQRVCLRLRIAVTTPTSSRLAGGQRLSAG
jgi:hypothetical protein